MISMPIGKISEAVGRKACKAVEKRGLVVWYDSEEVYSNCLQKEKLFTAPIIRFEGSFFMLRRKLESLLEFVTPEGSMKADADQPPQVIVYVPLKRDDCGWALVEAETAGCVLEPGSTSPDLNTRLSNFVKEVFGQISPANVETLVRQTEEGVLTLEELDRIAEETSGPASGALHLLFGKVSIEEVLLSFVASDDLDVAISEKKAQEELAGIAFSEVGFEWEEGEGLDNFRSGLTRHLLMCDFLQGIPEGYLPETLNKQPLPDKPMQKDLIRHLCSLWRNRMDLKEAYLIAARSVEKAYLLDAIAFSPESLKTVETFPFVDRLLVNNAASMLIKGCFEEARSLARLRLSQFWAREEPERRIEWGVLEAAASLCLEAGRVRAELKKMAPSLYDYVQAYAAHSEPWMNLDRLARQIETRYARLEPFDGESGTVEPVVNKARFLYAEILHELALAYSETSAKEEFRHNKILSQTSVFKEKVQPFIEKKEKVAYFLVDALRYEMAAEMAEGFGETSEVLIEPVLGQLPGITIVGMAALMPRAENGIEVEEKNGKICLQIQGKSQPSRAARMDWIRASARVPTAIFKLGEIVKLTPKKKMEIEEACLIVVTSQEIDRLGEDGAEEEETRLYMDEVLEKIRRAIRSLSRAGISRFVITADHGFQMLGLPEPGLEMDAPGGDKLELHSRVWIGKGGMAKDSFLRCRASDLELAGDLEFAFPKGIGTFKVPGGTGNYFHGGLSLQENVLPLVCLKIRGTSDETSSGLKVMISMTKTRITNRIFMVVLEGESKGLFPAEEKHVRLEIVSGEQELGMAVAASYGFDDASREILVSIEKPNSVTLMLSSGDLPRKVTLRVVDPENQLVLDSIKDISVELAI